MHKEEIFLKNKVLKNLFYFDSSINGNKWKKEQLYNNLNNYAQRRNIPKEKGI